MDNVRAFDAAPFAAILSDLLHEPVTGYLVVGFIEAGDQTLLNTFGTPERCNAHRGYVAAMTDEVLHLEAMVRRDGSHKGLFVDEPEFSFEELADRLGMDRVCYVVTIDHYAYVNAYRNYAGLDYEHLEALGDQFRELDEALRGGRGPSEWVH